MRVLTSLLLVLVASACKRDHAPEVTEETLPVAGGEVVDAPSKGQPSPSAAPDHAIEQPQNPEPGATKPTTMPGPVAEPTMATPKQIAALDEGCQLVGADEDHVYLTPGMLGSERMLRVGVDGTVDDLTFAERFKPHVIVSDRVYGCAGERQDGRCQVVRAPLSGGAVEGVASRGRVVHLAVAGSRLWTVELNEGSTTPTLMVGPLDGDAAEVRLDEPMRLAPLGEGVIVATGGTVKTGGIFVVDPTGRVAPIVENALFGPLVADGPWIYVRDGRDRLVRLPNGGGEPEALRPAPDQMGRRFGLVDNATHLFWIEPEGTAEAGKPLPRRLVMQLPKPR